MTWLWHEDLAPSFDLSQGQGPTLSKRLYIICCFRVYYVGDSHWGCALYGAMEKATSRFWDSAGRRESVMVSAIITGEKNYTQEQVRSQTESWDFEDDITLQASNGNANGGRDGKWRNCDVFSNLTDNGRKLYNQTRRNDLSIWAIFLRSFYIFCSAQLLLVRLGGFEDL